MATSNPKIKSGFNLSRIKKSEELFTGERISIEQYNLELDAAIKRIDKGDFLTHEEVVKRFLK
ncbi:hypothetical protein BH11BAC7_BH11BAC7_07350 [soil metagenome]